MYGQNGSYNFSNWQQQGQLKDKETNTSSQISKGRSSLPFVSSTGERSPTMLSEWDPLINIGVALFKRDLESKTLCCYLFCKHCFINLPVEYHVWCQRGQFVLLQNSSWRQFFAPSLWPFRAPAAGFASQRWTMNMYPNFPVQLSLNSIF